MKTYLNEEIKKTLESKSLLYSQKIRKLAYLAEQEVSEFKLSNEVTQYYKEGYFDDLFEGSAPYRPRYILPDYEKFLKEGSSFLRIPPAKNLKEALNFLLIFYHQVPSITTYPVFIGELDLLLNPFIEKELRSRDEIKEDIKLFLMQIDRNFPDSFLHANIGPKHLLATEIILEAEMELQNSVPNLSLKYDPLITTDEIALKAIESTLKISKPYFINDTLYKEEFSPHSYGIASCYNSLLIGGGSYTLARLNLKKVATLVSKEEVQLFLEKTLPKFVNYQIELMDERIHYLVSKSSFFENNFLVEEGFIKKDLFTAMFGIFGLSECIEYFLSDKIYGYHEETKELAIKILNVIEKIINDHKNPHIKFKDGNFLLHSQSGISSDYETTPGHRISTNSIARNHLTPIDEILFCAPINPFFKTGSSEILVFDQTALNNPTAILDIIKGGIKSGSRALSLYQKDSDLVRITGYLVKKSDMKKLKEQNKALSPTTELGLELIDKKDSFNFRKPYGN